VRASAFALALSQICIQMHVRTKGQTIDSGVSCCSTQDGCVAAIVGRFEYEQFVKAQVCACMCLSLSRSLCVCVCVCVCVTVSRTSCCFLWWMMLLALGQAVTFEMCTDPQDKNGWAVCTAPVNTQPEIFRIDCECKDNKKWPGGKVLQMSFLVQWLLQRPRMLIHMMP
jgi:hypothetical protein